MCLPFVHEVLFPSIAPVALDVPDGLRHEVLPEAFVVFHQPP